MRHSRAIRLMIGIWLCSVLLCGAYPTRAQGWPPPAGYGGVSLTPDQFFGVPAGGIATPEALDEAVGSAQYDVQCPENIHTFNGSSQEAVGTVAGMRGVRITLSNSGLGYRNPSVLNALLRNGAIAVFSQCDMTVPVTGATWYAIGFADIYGSPAATAPETVLVHATAFDHFTRGWTRIRDVQAEVEESYAADQARQEAVAEAQAQTVQQAAQQQQAAQAQAALQQQAAASEAAREQEQISEQHLAAQKAFEDHLWWNSFWDTAKTLFWLGVAAIIGIWLLRHWEMFARWYYLLTPHPATDMVQGALTGGAILDGEAFQEILRPVPGSRIEQEVRQKQAARLAEFARQSNAALERKAEELRKKLREQAKYQAAHVDLHDATLEQQLAAARTEALMQMHDLMNQGTANERE